MSFSSPSSPDDDLITFFLRLPFVFDLAAIGFRPRGLITGASSSSSSACLAETSVPPDVRALLRLGSDFNTVTLLDFVLAISCSSSDSSPGKRSSPSSSGTDPSEGEGDNKACLRARGARTGFCKPVEPDGSREARRGGMMARFRSSANDWYTPRRGERCRSLICC